MTEKETRVLSIQSHVVHGYVGNRSATFPLQYLGFEVDVINSVQFSNHTGYKNWKGQILSADDLKELYSGLKSNDLVEDYTHVLSGYMGDVGFLRALVEIVTDLKAANPDLKYVCDPVLGDYDQGMYVPKALIPIYIDEVLPVADLICPNQYEAEMMTELKITNEAEAFAAMDKLHSKGPRVVVLSSAEYVGNDELAALVSDRRTDQHRRAKITMKKLPCNFTGTGDLFAALVLANSLKTDDYGLVVKRTIESMQDVLKNTIDFAKKKRGSLEAAGRKDTELRLIQSRRSFENPSTEVTIEVLLP